MDLGTLVTVGGAVAGQISHIVKKRTEGKESAQTEAQFLKSWVVDKPATTLISVVGSLVAAFMLHIDGGDVWQQFMSAFTAGLAGNSVLNRQGGETKK